MKDTKESGKNIKPFLYLVKDNNMIYMGSIWPLTEEDIFIDTAGNIFMKKIYLANSDSTEFLSLTYLCQCSKCSFHTHEDILPETQRFKGRD